MAKTRKKGARPPKPAARTARIDGFFADADDMRPRIGRPRFQPTEKDRRFVSRMSRLGLSHSDMAVTLGIDRETLVRYFRQEIDEGRIEGDAAVAASLFQKATAKQVSGASVQAAIYWLRRRAEWLEAQRPRDAADEAGANEIVVTGGLPERDLPEAPAPKPKGE